MQPRMSLVLVLAAAAGAAAQDGNWTLHKMADAAAATGAVCLDGSPAAYYLRTPLVAPVAGASSFVVFMEGGGWCGSDANCLSRAGTDLGSSSNYPDKIGSAEATGLYDTFANSTIVYVKYCDGGSFTGDASAAVPVTDGAGGKHLIYYRGRRVFDALFDELIEARGLGQATELLFAGCSAGALTAYTHADYVGQVMQARVPGAKVVALADAMFSLHHDAYPAIAENYYTRQFVWGYTAWNSSASVNQACRARYGAKNDADAWVCFHGAVAAQFVSTPLFVANSKYDTWQERGVLGLNTTQCPGTVASNGTVVLCKGPGTSAEEVFWLAYGQAMIEALTPLPRQHAAYLTNCPTHCQTAGPGWRNPAFPGTRLDAAVTQWYGEAMAHVTPGHGADPAWDAPRWVAQEGQPCAPHA